MYRLVWNYGGKVVVQEEGTIEELIKYATQMYKNGLGIPNRIVDEDGEVVVGSDELYSRMKKVKEEDINE